MSVTVNKINPVVFFVAREQAFTFTLSGLLPGSVHYMYFERKKVDSTKIKPIGKLLGDPIVTDSNGKVVFEYFYNSDLPVEKTTLEQAQRLTELVAGKKEVVVTTLNQTTLPDNYKEVSLSVYTTNIALSVYIPPTNEFAEILQEETIVRPYVAPVVDTTSSIGGDGGGYSGGGGWD